jgi:hypothetical protein
MSMRLSEHDAMTTRRGQRFSSTHSRPWKLSWLAWRLRSIFFIMEVQIALAYCLNGYATACPNVSVNGYQNVKFVQERNN